MMSGLYSESKAYCVQFPCSDIPNFNDTEHYSKSKDWVVHAQSTRRIEGDMYMRGMSGASLVVTTQGKLFLCKISENPSANVSD